MEGKPQGCKNYKLVQQKYKFQCQQSSFMLQVRKFWMQKILDVKKFNMKTLETPKAANYTIHSGPSS